MSGPLDLVTGPLRSLLGVAERSPLSEAGKVEHELTDAVEAVHESLAASVPPLTDSVNALVKELNGLLGVVAPIAAAERDIAATEHEISRIERLFGRRRHSEAPNAAGDRPLPGSPSAAGAKPPAGADQQAPPHD